MDILQGMLKEEVLFVLMRHGVLFDIAVPVKIRTLHET